MLFPVVEKLSNLDGSHILKNVASTNSLVKITIEKSGKSGSNGLVTTIKINVYMYTVLARQVLFHIWSKVENDLEPYRKLKKNNDKNVNVQRK